MFSVVFGIKSRSIAHPLSALALYCALVGGISLNFSENARASGPRKSARAPAVADAAPNIQGGGRNRSPLDVRGQNRAWSKMVRARGDKESVNFVQTRKDYRAEIESIRF